MESTVCLVLSFLFGAVDLTSKGTLRLSGGLGPPKVRQDGVIVPSRYRTSFHLRGMRELWP